MLEESEGAKELRRTQGSNIIKDVSKTTADTKYRRHLIDVTIKIWHERFPKRTKWLCDQMGKMAQMDNKNGEYEGGQGYMAMRMPRELFINLRQVFDRCAPDLETFGTDHSDIEYLRAQSPKLMPSGARGKARKS